MTFSSPYLEKLSAAWPPKRWRDVTVLLAVSGGADSVALTRGLAELRLPGEGRLILAHFNHRLRSAESDADQTFVENLAGQLGLDILTGAAPDSPPLPLSSTPPPSSEAALRDLRYAFLCEAANKTGARYVATAHTADDQVETVLHNLLRGSGLAGVAGIPRVRPLTPAAALIRPLLDITREEILDYLQSRSQPYRDDLTNQLLHYTRNRIRHELLPLLARDYNPHVRAALLRLARITEQADDYLDRQAEHLLSTISRPMEGGVALRLAPLAAAHPALARQTLLAAWKQQGWPLQDMSWEKWEELRLLASQPVRAGAHRKQLFPGQILVETAADELRITR